MNSEWVTQRRDEERNQILRAQTYEIAEQNRILREQRDLMDRQVRLEQDRLNEERQRLAFMQEVQRASDLGISHQELQRRKNDLREAERELKFKKLELRNASDPRDTASELDAKLFGTRRRRTRREVRALYWRNRWNWLRSPRQTAALIKPFAEQIRASIKQEDDRQVQDERNRLARERRRIPLLQGEVQAAEAEVARRASRV